MPSISISSCRDACTLLAGLAGGDSPRWSNKISANPATITVTESASSIGKALVVEASPRRMPARPVDSGFTATSTIVGAVRETGGWQALFGRLEQVVFELGEDAHRSPASLVRRARRPRLTRWRTSASEQRSSPAISG